MRHLTAILHHRPAPERGPAHFDLLIGSPASAPGDLELRDVLTWRCGQRPDRLEPDGTCDLEPIEPHRRWWLDRPIGEFHALRPPLGEVEVVANGTIERLERSGGVLKFGVRWSQYDGVFAYAIDDAVLCRLPHLPDRPVSVSP